MIRSAMFLVVALVLAGPARGNCPLNHIFICEGGTRDSSLPVDLQSCSIYGPTACQVETARYDIPNGALVADVKICGDGYGSAYVEVQDDFSLFGLPAGTSVALVAHFEVGISSDFLGYAKGRGVLSDAFGHSVNASLPGVTDLTIDVPVVAGQSFRLSYELYGQGNYYGGGGASGQISFSGIPPGGAVVSCNGYVSDRAVAVRHASWTNLKNIYR